MRNFYTGLFLLLLYFGARSQANTGLLQTFANPQLFNLNDKSCHNLAGEWQGEEVEYISEGKVKGTYTVSFILSQEGNRVSGTSLISCNNGATFGNMKIRGLVAGNKFYFEEYEVLDQKFATPGVSWCLRTGELDIRSSGQEALLEGGNYKGYAAFYYFDCQGFAAMRLHKSMPLKETKAVEKNSPDKAACSMQLHPNPANREVTVSFKLPEDAQVRVDLFTLSGELITNITSEFYTAGTYQKVLPLETYAAGAYLVRLQAGNQSAARILVIAR